jgi:glucose/arabinose dehydrogenase/putative cell wall-binding protein
MSRMMPALLLAAALLAGPAPAAAGHAQVERLAGPDRYATAAAVSHERFPDGAGTVFVATGADFPDALAGGPAAGVAEAPILLVERDRVPAPTRTEIGRLDPDEVVILGGEGAISRAVEGELALLTASVPQRIAGADRYATAAAVSGAHFAPGVPVAYVATGAAFPDALAGAAAGAARGGPVLLTRPEGLPAVTRDELDRLEPGEIVVLGGQAAISPQVAEQLDRHTDGQVRRLAGHDRYATAAEVAGEHVEADTVWLATGAVFADALAGAPAGQPLLLTPPHCVPDQAWARIQHLGPARLVLLGGSAALGPGAEHLLTCAPPEVTVLADGLELPWDIAFAPDGRTFITERDSGRVLERVADGSFAEVQRLSVNAAGEGGLLGLTPDADYGRTGLLYAYLTTSDDNRIVRFRPGQQPEPVLTGIPRANIHDGGRIAFGPDGMLYATTGDAAQPALSQRRDTLAGKILRMTRDGQPAPGNPDPGSHIYALGIRNAQGLAWDRDDRLFATEFGPAVDDEVNVIVPGGNYGWPEVTGAAGDPRFIDPVIVRQPPEASWSGAAIVSNGAVPEWEGDLFVAALRGQRLWPKTARSASHTSPTVAMCASAVFITGRRLSLPSAAFATSASARSTASWSRSARMAWRLATWPRIAASSTRWSSGSTSSSSVYG